MDLNEPQGGFDYSTNTYIEDFIHSDSKSHSVGCLAFLLDGTLLVSTGDGGSYNRVDDRIWRVMDVDSLSGKVIRIDPITGKGLPNNPYYNGDPDANRSKVYQSGIRNSWRMTVCKTTGKVYLGEVGWNSFEEINTGGSGANFGWPYYEGKGVLDAYADTPEGESWKAQGVSVTSPLYEISHASTGIDAIVLGDKLSSNYYGSKYKDNLFFNEFGRGTVRHLSLDSSGNVDAVDVFATGAKQVVSIQEGPDGILYYCDLDDGIVGRWERDD